MTTTLTEALDRAATHIDQLVEATNREEGEVFATVAARTYYRTALDLAYRAVNDARKVLG